MWGSKIGRDDPAHGQELIDPAVRDVAEPADVSAFINAALLRLNLVGRPNCFHRAKKPRTV